MSYQYFENNECEFFPCHKADELNCLFCFCPLYNYDCGGNYLIIKGENGEDIKDCSECMIPHTHAGYDFVIERLKQLQTGKDEGKKDGY